MLTKKLRGANSFCLIAEWSLESKTIWSKNGAYHYRITTFESHAVDITLNCWYHAIRSLSNDFRARHALLWGKLSHRRWSMICSARVPQQNDLRNVLASAECAQMAQMAANLA
jgi:hypothetical protein